MSASESDSFLRRSSRIKSRRAAKKDEEEEEEENGTNVSAEEQESEHKRKTKRYKSKLRDRGKLNGSVEETDLANLEGDVDATYEDGDCVWAKYKDFPWWPGQIAHVSKRKRARSRRGSGLCVKWFGEFAEKSNVCKKQCIIPWDPEERDRIYPEVDEADDDSFKNCVDECNSVHLQLCEERGIDPGEAALDYDRVNASKSSKQCENGIPDLEEVNDEFEDIDLKDNERRSSLRSASKRKGTKQPKVAIKKRRGRKRQFKEAMDEDDKEEESEKENEQKKVSNGGAKRRRRSNRRRQQKEEEKKEESEVEMDEDEVENEGESDSDCMVHADAALEMVQGTHSSEDFTPWIALFHFRMKGYLKKKLKAKYDEDEVAKMVANSFELQQDEFFQHLSEFTEMENESKNPKKKKKKRRN